MHSHTFTFHTNNLKWLQISYRTKYERDQEEQMCAFSETVPYCFHRYER